MLQKSEAPAYIRLLVLVTVKKSHDKKEQDALRQDRCPPGRYFSITLLVLRPAGKRFSWYPRGKIRGLLCADDRGNSLVLVFGLETKHTK